MPAGRGAVALAALAAVGAGCGGERPELKTFADTAGYAVGMRLAGSVRDLWPELRRDIVIAALRETVDGRPARMSRFEGMLAIQAIAARLQDARDAQARENATAGWAYEEENRRRPEVTTTASGLQYEVLQPGTGPTPGIGDTVRIHYRGTLVDGTEFKNTYGGDPDLLVVHEAILGLAEVLSLMPVGAKYRVVLPPDLGYGPIGAPGIGPDATLVFEIELLGIGS